MTPKKPISLSEAAAILGQAGGRAKVANMTTEERSRLARLGGLARQKQMTNEQREALAASGGKASKGVPKTKRKDKQP